MAWCATILTLFPEIFPGPLGASLAGDALKRGLWSLETRQIREHGLGRHRSVDDTPAGGGPGMVMRADVLAAALDAVIAVDNRRPRLSITPRGVPFAQAAARELAAGQGVVIVCGRFEGVDERVIEARGLREVSIGDFVLAGGEIAAMAIIESSSGFCRASWARKAPAKKRASSAGVLEYPHYTRPREWEGRPIPEVLLSGDHARIEAWRRAEAERHTRERRPDLFNPKTVRREE